MAAKNVFVVFSTQKQSRSLWPVFFCLMYNDQYFKYYILNGYNITMKMIDWYIV